MFELFREHRCCGPFAGCAKAEAIETIASAFCHWRRSFSHRRPHRHKNRLSLSSPTQAFPIISGKCELFPSRADHLEEKKSLEPSCLDTETPQTGHADPITGSKEFGERESTSRTSLGAGKTKVFRMPFDASPERKVSFMGAVAWGLLTFRPTGPNMNADDWAPDYSGRLYRQTLVRLSNSGCWNQIAKVSPFIDPCGL
jgi:hypothetical protein